MGRFGLAVSPALLAHSPRFWLTAGAYGSGCLRLLSQHDFVHPALLPCRIDFAQDIMGPIESITGSIATFCPRDKNPDGTDCAPSEVDDWTALIGRFKNGATGVWEGSTVMKGYKFGGFGKEWAEVNGSVATAVYQMGDPNNLLFGKHGESLGESRQPLRSGNTVVRQRSKCSRALWQSRSLCRRSSSCGATARAIRRRASRARCSGTMSSTS